MTTIPSGLAANLPSQGTLGIVVLGEKQVPLQLSVPSTNYISHNSLEEAMAF